MSDNPKLIRAMKEGKIPYEKIPWTVLASDARVHAHGAEKYGERNWRIDKILASTYEGAIMRHLMAWAMGEDIDPDSGEPHLNHIRACCAVVLDAQASGTLIDDRDRQESLNENDTGNGSHPDCYESSEPVEIRYEPGGREDNLSGSGYSYATGTPTGVRGGRDQ